MLIHLKRNIWLRYPALTENLGGAVAANAAVKILSKKGFLSGGEWWLSWLLGQNLRSITASSITVKHIDQDLVRGCPTGGSPMLFFVFCFLMGCGGRGGELGYYENIISLIYNEQNHVNTLCKQKKKSLKNEFKIVSSVLFHNCYVLICLEVGKN